MESDCRNAFAHSRSSSVAVEKSQGVVEAVVKAVDVVVVAADVDADDDDNVVFSVLAADLRRDLRDFDFFSVGAVMFLIWLLPSPQQPSPLLASSKQQHLLSIATLSKAAKLDE